MNHVYVIMLNKTDDEGYASVIKCSESFDKANDYVIANFQSIIGDWNNCYVFNTSRGVYSIVKVDTATSRISWYPGGYYLTINKKEVI